MDNLMYRTPTHAAAAAAGTRGGAGAVANAAKHETAGPAEDMLPEHLFAIQMARAQPWKDRYMLNILATGGMHGSRPQIIAYKQHTDK